MEVETIRSAERLRALQPDWRELWARSGRTTPFQRPEWMLPWWRYFGAGDLLAVAVWEHGSLAALAPLYARPDGTGAFVGTGNTDRVDVLVAVDADDAVLRAIVEQLGAPAAPDRWDLFPLDAASPLLRALTGVAWDDELQEHDVYPCLGLPAVGDELADVMSARRLKKMYAARRQLAALGSVTTERADVSSAAEAIAALAELHGARWSARGSAGVLHDDDLLHFHTEVATGMAAAGLLRLYLLRVDGRLAAAFYGLASGETVYYYLGGFDPQLARYSPGSLVVLHAIEQAVESGATRFDFLNGGEAYKYAWGATAHPLYRRQLSRRARRPPARP